MSENHNESLGRVSLSKVLLYTLRFITSSPKSFCSFCVAVLEGLSVRERCRSCCRLSVLGPSCSHAAGPRWSVLVSCFPRWEKGFYFLYPLSWDFIACLSAMKNLICSSCYSLPASLAGVNHQSMAYSPCVLEVPGRSSK